ncbi:MAG: TPM domain-containing protein [Gammaproteobacteria bacterium]
MIFWGALCLVFCAPLWAEVPIPRLTARIIDLTGMLSAGERLDLENKLQAFENAKGSQIAVLIVPTTRPEAIEQYSMRVVEQWRLGRKGVDDGALLLVAKDDRKLRIEVGYGLEGVLTDATSKRIISEVITPLFKAGEFYPGIAAGIDRMIRVIEGEPLPPEPSGRSPDDLIGGTVFALLMAFTVGSVVLSIASVLLPRATARLGGAALNGAITGAIAWSLTKGLSIALIVAALGFVIALVIGSLPTRRAGRWSSGNWRGGGFGGNGGGSGGSGGFSGGGGSFGGGGASGSW